MFSKKGGKAREKPAAPARPGDDLANMFGIGGQMEADDDDDSDLLAELAALEGGSHPQPAKKKAAAAKQGPVSMAVIEQMAADSMKDANADDDSDIDENDLLGELEDLIDDGDEEVEDTDTGENQQMAQLNLSDEQMRQKEDEELQLAMALSLSESGQKPNVPPPQAPIRAHPPAQTSRPAQSFPPSNDIKSILKDRKNMYLQAIEEANKEGNGSKVRRLQRGLKDIDGWIKKADRGVAIKEDEIPPAVFVSGSTPVESESSAVMPASTPAPTMQSSTQEINHTSPHETLIPDLPAPPVRTVSPHPSPRPRPPPAQTQAHPPAQPRPAQSSPPSNDIKSILRDRKSKYLQAIEEAKEEGNGSKVRRLQRGLKDLDGWIKKADRGIAIKEDEIPPAVFVSGSIPAESESSPARPATTPAPAIPSPQQLHHTSPPETQPISVDNTKLQMLLTRQKEFKVAALKMKQADNVEMARKFLTVSKKLQVLIDDVNAGKDVDVSLVPNVPQDATTTTGPAKVSPPPETTTGAQGKENEVQAGSSSLSQLPPQPQTVMEDLQQRLLFYQTSEQEAKAEGNGSKARRMGRVIKQYQDAIKCYKSNRPVDYEALPPPPGYDPIPAGTGSQERAAAPLPTTPASRIAEDNESISAPQVPTAAPARSKEYEFLVNRQKEFKLMALQAKKVDDIENAREYLRTAKSLDPMIEAAGNGQPVDMKKVPPLPSKAKQNSESAGSSIGKSSTSVKTVVEFDGNSAQQYIQIETALKKQIETSGKNLEHYKLLGNLDATKNFQSLLQSSQKDLNTLLAFKDQGAPVPKCQTVLKTFPVIRSNPHLSDSELEVIIIRCTNIPLPSGWAPKDMYSYVTFEMAYPQEKPQTGNTTTKKETVNPEFNEPFKLLIERKNRVFLRYCKRNGINLKLFYVRGFLKADKALGQATIKFEDFNNKCEIHECLDLMDVEKGRKAVGGKIEVKLKIRDSLVEKETEIIKENWLVLDTHLRGLDMSTATHAANASAASSSGFESLEVLRFEKEICEKKMAAYKSQNKNPPAALVEAIKSYQQKVHFIQTKMKEGGRSAINEYLVALTNGLERQRTLAQDALKKNDKEAAKLCLAKKKLIDKEVAVIKQRLGH